MHTELALVMQLYGLLQLFEPFAIIRAFCNYMAYISQLYGLYFQLYGLYFLDYMDYM